MMAWPPRGADILKTATDVFFFLNVTVAATGGELQSYIYNTHTKERRMEYHARAQGGGTHWGIRVRYAILPHLINVLQM